MTDRFKLYYLPSLGVFLFHAVPRRNVGVTENDSCSGHHF